MIYSTPILTNTWSCDRPGNRGILDCGGMWQDENVSSNVSLGQFDDETSRLVNISCLHGGCDTDSVFPKRGHVSCLAIGEYLDCGGGMWQRQECVRHLRLSHRSTNMSLGQLTFPQSIFDLIWILRIPRRRHPVHIMIRTLEPCELPKPQHCPLPRKVALRNQPTCLKVEI